MAKLKGIQKLIDALEKLQTVAEEVRQNLDEKQDWWNDKSERFQESEKGQEWDDHFIEVENLLDEVENISIPDFED